MTSAHPKPKSYDDIAPAVREKLKTAYTPADLFDPASDGNLLTTAVDVKAWAEAGRGAAQGLGRARRLGSEKEKLEAVEQQFARVSVAAGRDLGAARQALAAFAGWRDYPGGDAWGFFVDLQGPLAKFAKDVVVEQRWVAWLEGTKQTTQAIAFTETKRHANGPDGVVGTVIAGMADGAGGSWVGTSGHGAVHRVMWDLLDGVNQVEAWETHVCGEVDAMNQYLVAHAVNSVADIPVGGVFSHAQTWDAGQRKWKARAACGNCEQWLKRIGAYLS
ncbi:hypothetical protein L6E12_08770 [Actinokineospora sp. PR83]|uniref:hypothetical protein n=1 Tax=Actinokineospora sp. PR83 TaxID=2884908 RepID=UPI001F25EC84|nr:hypothetical protein [Actinokineospora sp. PR83]MCG8915878.1 hypothetical protein [Actinokineospora sp. PR83]